MKQLPPVNNLHFPFLNILCIFLLASCTRPPSWQHDEGTAFGTLYSITYQHTDDLQQEIELALEQVDREFSMFNEHSTVARINRGDSEVERSAMFQEVYHLAQAVSSDTNGAFDITIAPLVNAWGFGFKHDKLPTKQQVDSLLNIRSQMDFAAIAKGYACDVVARMLQSHDIRNYMVEIGGEVALSGTNHHGDCWHIGINKPVDDPLAQNTSLQDVLSITDIAMATSGNYRNFYYKDGIKYAHTIDPRTGYPVQHELLSATVLANDCATADAYATAFMVLGLDSAKTLLARHPDLSAYLIFTDENGNHAVWHSPELTEHLR